ncbi:hypothetical protein H8959_005409 [Pygathrix nigripes]
MKNRALLSNPQGSNRRSHQPARQSTAAIPSSGSLLATYDYYRRRLDSTSSNSSCGSTECPGEVIPHPPGLPKADPGHWWASFFFWKSTFPFMATVLESAEHPDPPPGPPAARPPVVWLGTPRVSPAQPALGPGPDLSGYHQPRPVEALVHQSPSPPPAPFPTSHSPPCRPGGCSKQAFASTQQTPKRSEGPGSLPPGPGTG